MNEDLGKYIVNLINDENFEEEVKKITPDMLKEILLLDDYTSQLFISKCQKYNIKFFTEEVADEYIRKNDNLLNPNNDIYREMISILNISDKCVLELYFKRHAINDLSFLKESSKLIDIFFYLYKKRENLYVVLNAMNEEQKDFVFNKVLLPSTRYETFESFKTDEMREKNFSKLGLSYKQTCINYFKSDELKIKHMSEIPFNRTDIITCLKDDSIKEGWMIKNSFFLSKKDKIKIFASFDNIELIKKYIHYINNEKDLSFFLRNASISVIKKNYDYFKQIFLSITNEKYLFQVLIDNTDVLDPETEKILISRITNYNYLVQLYEYGYDKETIFSKMKQNELVFFARKNMSFIEYEQDGYKILYYLQDKETILKIFEHLVINCEYDDKLFHVFEIVADHYHLNINHLIILAKMTNCGILNVIENEYLIKAINLDDVSFQKYLKIFDEKNYNLQLSTIFNIDNAFLQSRFRLENDDLINIFINTLHNIKDNKQIEAIKKIHEVCRIIDLKKYHISKHDLIHGLFSNNQEIIKLYNNMTNEYLTIIRNKYVANHLADSLTSSCYIKYNKNFFVKYILKVVPLDLLIDGLKRAKYQLNLSSFTEEEQQFLNNNELLIQIAKFKKYPQLYPQVTPEMKKFFNTFETICYAMGPYYYPDIRIKNPKLEYDLFHFSKNFLIDVMMNIDTDKLKDIYFKDDDLFNKLLKYLKKYQVLGWDKRAERIAESADIDLSSSVIASIINNFNIILDKKTQAEKKGEYFGLISELELAECLDSEADIYLYLMGSDVYRTFKANPGPNKSPWHKKERFAKFLELLKKLNSRDKITVPPMDEDLTLKSNKQLNVRVGDCKDLYNFILGEKTGACMRIGGAGKTLFEFCLLNENGFHITFNDPQTGELVSRVSCYRNGNTLFLNQLRNSLSDKYDDSDIREACQMIAQKIIEATKDSKYPIENVVSSPYYAYTKFKTTHVNLLNPIFTLPKFYTDVDNDLVVVATNRNGQLAPIKLGANRAERYDLKRTKIRQYSGKKAFFAVAQIHTTESFKNNVPISEITIPEKFDVITAYVGEDWYIALLPNGQIINYIQKNSQDIKAAQMEMSKYQQIIEEQLNDIKLASLYDTNGQGGMRI